jgi:hypothetical protein
MLNPRIKIAILLSPLLRDLNQNPKETERVFKCDVNGVVALDSDPAIASQKLQIDLLAIQNWFKK